MPNVSQRFAAVFPTAVISRAMALAIPAGDACRSHAYSAMYARVLAAPMTPKLTSWRTVARCDASELGNDRVVMAATFGLVPFRTGYAPKSAVANPAGQDRGTD